MIRLTHFVFLSAVRWLEIFPREQLLLVNGDQLIEDPLSQIRRIEDFLGKLWKPPGRYLARKPLLKSWESPTPRSLTSPKALSNANPSHFYVLPPVQPPGCFRRTFREMQINVFLLILNDFFSAFSRKKSKSLFVKKTWWVLKCSLCTCFSKMLLEGSFMALLEVSTNSEALNLSSFIKIFLSARN